jgi:hypothetical protein
MNWGCPNCERENVGRVNVCVHCGEERPGTATGARFSLNVCARCGSSSRNTAAFYPDDTSAHPQDRGVRLCPGCWIPALARRAAGSSQESRGPDGRTVREYTAEAKRHTVTITARAVRL